MKLKEYEAGRPIILRKLPVLYHRPGELKEVCSTTLVRVKRILDHFPDLFMQREILIYQGETMPEPSAFDEIPMKSFYGRDKVVVYHHQTIDGKPKFYTQSSQDTQLVFGENGKSFGCIKP